MKILYFTFITPSEKFGGGLGVLQTIEALSQIAEVDYVGPQYEDEAQSYVERLNASYFITINNSIVKRVKNLIFNGSTTGFYDSWKEIVDNNIDIGQYDCVYLEFTRQSFIANWTKKNHKPLIIKAHNVECDYFHSIYKKDKSIVNYIRFVTAKKHEKKCVNKCDKLAVLTECDKKRLVQLYNINEEKILPYPVCVKKFYGEPLKREKNYILITGSLWFGPNAEGTYWFVNNVWNILTDEVKEKYDLVIAGANPNQKLKDVVESQSGIELYDTPESIEPFYLGASIYVSPIFYGAGMKVKNAEALSCGLPIVTTSHAIAGYESAASVIRIADTAEEFKTEIEELARLSDDEMKLLNMRALDIYQDNYSMEQSKKYVETIINETIGCGV
jgi:glycosyltransferase involved in cell wall biosynthesis